MKNYIIRPETPKDHREVENLVRESFWNVYRPGCYEHYLIHVLRDKNEFVKELGFVMEQDGKIIGQNAFTKAEIKADDGRIIPVLTMGPICITPELKRKGYGKILLDYSLEKAAELGYGAVCFEGNIDFYGKSGFVVASTMNIHYDGEPREAEVPYFLCKELKKGYLDGIEGTFYQPMAEYVDEDKAEAFDKQFPYKEKMKLPGQLF
ncbi:MAG: N-acetyltransferase [Eubacteriales bacterium]|nr:N-acetyltransferase [Eubacteriales bacterium]